MIHKEKLFSLIFVIALAGVPAPLLKAQSLDFSSHTNTGQNWGTIADEQDEPYTRIGINAGITICSGAQGPGLTVGIYDVGGSRAGVDLGGYIMQSDFFTWGADAALIIRTIKNLYAKAGMGVFSCKDRRVSIGEQPGTFGLCPGIGLTYVIGKHLNLGVYARFMPETKIRSNSMVPTSVDKEYPFAEEVVAIKSGLAPSVTIGWIF
ncbi:MAG: hypothetical protein IJS30_02950 [Bacteroidales bacterium]|nr:hypothetical protein [Bacteroidales bacterium]